MLNDITRVLSVAILVTFCLPPASGNGQEEILELELGKFASFKEEMGQLIQINQSQGKLILEQPWQKAMDRERANEAPGEARKIRIQELIDRGLPVNDAEMMADRQLNRDNVFRNSSQAILDAFDKVRKGIGANSYGSGGGGENVHAHFSSLNGCAGEVRRDKDLVRFKFSDDGQGNSEFSFKLQNDEFSFRFINNDYVIDLSQNRKQTRLAVVNGESAEVHVAADYATLARENPEVIEGLLIPLWNKLGVAKPMRFSDEAIIAAAIEKLTATENDEMEVISLVDDLESDNTSSRNIATEKLMECFFKWESLIKSAIESKEFEPEAQTRIDKILRSSPGTRAQDFVDSRNLLDSAESLVELLAAAPKSDRPLIIRRLQLVTGNDFGGDVAKWKKSLK